MLVESESISSRRFRNFSFALWTSLSLTQKKNLSSWNFLVVLWVLCFLRFNLSILSAAEPAPEPGLKPQAEQLGLESIQTILVTGTVKSWLKGGKPHYTVVPTLKLRLQDAGFKVIFDPALSHDANLRIQYEEYPSGQFQVLEQATALTYSLQLVHSHLGEIFSRDFDASPNPIPVGSLYWDTIGNLEENPHYYFLGDILWEHLHHGINEQSALLNILLKPYTDSNASVTTDSRSMNEATVLKRARLNAIKEMGQGAFNSPQARETLWKLAKKAQPNERHAAFTQLGIIGDPSMLADLTELMENETDPEVQSAAQQSIRLIESR